MNRHNYKWPVRSVEALSPVRPARPDNSVLIIGNSVRALNPSLLCLHTAAGTMFNSTTQGDPITPLAGAQSAARLLGDRATLVEQKTSGHTSLSVPVDCTLDIIKTYLLNSTVGRSFDVRGRNRLTPTDSLAILYCSYLKGMIYNAKALSNSSLSRTLRRAMPNGKARSLTRLFFRFSLF